MAKQKMTKKQREARIAAAEERERRQQAAQERASRTKRIFTIIVCVVLVLALGLPTVGLALCSSQQVEQAAAAQIESATDNAATQAVGNTLPDAADGENA